MRRPAGGPSVTTDGLRASFYKAEPEFAQRRSQASENQRAALLALFSLLEAPMETHAAHTSTSQPRTQSSSDPATPDTGPGKTVRAVLWASALLILAGLGIAIALPQYGGVIMAVGATGVLFGAITLGMSALGSRRRRGQSLRSAP